MENYVQVDDYELWMIIQNGPLIPKKTLESGSLVSKKPEEFNAEDFRMMEKNANARKLLYFGLGPDEYTCIFECESAKEIWDALQVAHEGTSQVKQSRIELFMRKYELFEMGNKETIIEMYKLVSSILLMSLSPWENPSPLRIGEENPEIFASIMGSQGDGRSRSQEHERNILG